MATKSTNIAEEIPGLNVDYIKIGIAVAEWNTSITNALLEGCVKTLKSYGLSEHHIKVINVPGSFELTHGTQMLLEKYGCDAAIAIGCIIQGETRHFDFISSAVAHGVSNVSIKYNKPTILGVLTTNDMAQAEDRAGGKLGNKGSEAAITALKMLTI